jgi:hypothetical protein
MSDGAAHLVDHVLPEVPVRQFVVTMPFPLRFPLAFDGKLLGQILRIFTDTVAKWYRERHVRNRILRFLQRRGVITLVAAPGDGELTLVTDETMAEKDPLLARLLAAATAGAPPAGPADKRKVIRIVFAPHDRPVARGNGRRSGRFPAQA